EVGEVGLHGDQVVMERQGEVAAIIEVEPALADPGGAEPGVPLCAQDEPRVRADALEPQARQLELARHVPNTSGEEVRRVVDLPEEAGRAGLGAEYQDLDILERRALDAEADEHERHGSLLRPPVMEHDARIVRAAAGPRARTLFELRAREAVVLLG